MWPILRLEERGAIRGAFWELCALPSCGSHPSLSMLSGGSKERSMHWDQLNVLCTYLAPAPTDLAPKIG